MNDKKKGYRVTDNGRKHKVGIAAANLKELTSRTIQKFKTIDEKNYSFIKNIHFQLVDGTDVDSEDYFQTLPAQTTLVWVEEGNLVETEAERLYKTIKEVNFEYLNTGEKVQEFVMTELKNKFFSISKIFESLDQDKAMLKTKLEDPEWFEGLDTRAKTKEEYLFRRSQDRIRTYYYKTKEELVKKNTKQLARLLKYLQEELKKYNYFGCYFDRRYQCAGDYYVKCLCDAKGNFYCQGKWDVESCTAMPKHQINPYVSRETRILFQIWNLDHRVERSRYIIPLLIKLRDSNEINHEKVFNDLFTIENLKLVHIVCHDKSKHLEATSEYENKIKRKSGQENGHKKVKV